MGYIDDYKKQFCMAAEHEEMTNEEIVEKIKEGHTELFEVLFAKNLRLIRSFISPYLQYLDENEMFQESYIALVGAVYGFDETQGKFTTYLYYKVRKRINVLNRSSNSLTERQMDDVMDYKKAFKCLAQTLGRTPDSIELSKYLSWSVFKVDKIALLSIGSRSLDEVLGDTDDTINLADTVEDYAQTEMMDNVINDQFMKEVWEKVHTIVDAVAQEILFLNIDAGLSIDEIAKMKKVSKPTIRNIWNEAITKLRKNREFQQFIEQSETLVFSSYLYGDGYSSFRNLGNSRVEETVLRMERVEKKHKANIKVISANHDLVLNKLSRLRK